MPKPKVEITARQAIEQLIADPNIEVKDITGGESPALTNLDELREYINNNPSNVNHDPEYIKPTGVLK